MSKQNMKKVVVVGEGRVGKTSMTLRYFKGEYNEGQEITVNASYLEKTVQISDTESVNIAVWDTAGQEKFRAMTPMYYNSALCAIIVYDITLKESFDKVKSWVKELQDLVDMNKIVLCIAGNKSDMENLRQIDKNSAEQYAASVGAKHFQTSAKNNRGIDELFLYVASEIQKRDGGKKQGSGRMIISSKATGENKKQRKGKNGSCC